MFEGYISRMQILEIIEKGGKPEEIIDNIWRLPDAEVEKKSRLANLYIKDKATGKAHKVGDDPHDSLWVDSKGTVHYHHLQCGDGCGAFSRTDDNAGFEFCESDMGTPSADVLRQAEEHRMTIEGFRRKQKELASKGIIILT